MQRYNPSEIEPKWQKIWDESGTYTTNLKSDKPKYLAMSMFNYPSGAGIHIGHAMNYTISDVKARFKRQQGFESYHPVGWDAFGLPAENYAIKAGVSPQESMANIIPGYHKQYKAMGWSNDWEKEVATHLPEYYKWTQWIFLQMHKHGLAYQDSRMQWWCTIDNTVLANEQVIDGKCWRHDGPDDPLVEKKEVKQWFFKITDYADALLEATEELDWTESVKLAQKNWIGRSQGAEVDFPIDEEADYLLLHGFTGTSQNNFLPLLKQKIEQLGRKVSVPDLPETETGNVKAQVKYVEDNYELTENTVLLGHSLGAVAALKAVENSSTPIKRLILVAGFAQPGFPDRERPFEKTFDWQFDFEKIKQNVGEIVILRATNDSAVPNERADYLAEKLDAEVTDFVAEADHATGQNEPVVIEKTLKLIKVFTTAHDTIYGTTFMVLAPEHELVRSITTDEQRTEVDAYIEEALKKTEVQRQQEGRDKTGVFTGSYAINPISGKKIPIWVADYVLAGYGTGAVMAVPGEDARDHEFADKFNLEIIYTTKEQEFVDYGDIKAAPDKFIVANSEEFDGMTFADARPKILQKLIDLKAGREKVNYKMRDWSVSRQRYWGAPIPMIDCPKCGAVPVPEKDLPVVLPEIDDFAPTGDGRSALARAKDWLTVNCPQCGGQAERETDTMDTYVDSSWYMYRYMDPHNQQAIVDPAVVKKWEPVDFYNGADHATAHLLYARFVGHFFKKIGLVDEAEPFRQFLFNGKVTANDGQMFSKSKGNGVDPLEIIESGYGADALRTYLMFAAPLDLWVRWDPQGVPGTHRFLSRIWNLVQEYYESEKREINKEVERELNRAVHSMIKKVREDLETNRYNTAIAAAMACTNDLYKIKTQSFGQNEAWQKALSYLVACIAPFAPHMADELWHQLGHSSTVHRDSWPDYDEKYLVSATIKIAVQVNGKVRATVEVPADTDQDQAINAAKADEKVSKYLAGKTVKKTIYVAGKLVSFVV